MVSRRRFLQTNIVGLTSSLAASSGLTTFASTQAASNLPNTSAKRDHWNDWPSYLTSKVSQFRAKRKAELASIRSQNEVRERIETVRSKVWKILGGPFDKTSLNPRTVG